MTNEEILALMEQKNSEGKIVYETEEGLFATTPEELLSTPINELLTKLQMIPQNLYNNSKNWVNEFAVINLLCYIKEKYYTDEPGSGDIDLDHEII